MKIKKASNSGSELSVFRTKKQIRKPAAYSLKKLAGGWSEKDASEFEESITSCEQIDSDM
ncbi:hypothetical protein D1AOALGA4SA_9860 [Olavius algarvensis Delta 1 endosymbiont]|nr:hypothetical protein D1AOALGA4SA_9860 [Olavius algarvensis Delta 1 endosymbiont]